MMVAVLAGCFQPALDFTEGELACDHGLCPPGYACADDSRCYRGARGGDPDAAPADAAEVTDASVPVEVDAPVAEVIDAAILVVDAEVVVDGEVVDGEIVDGGATPPPAPDARFDCVPGEGRCVDDDVERCDATGTWVVERSCPYLCVAESADCGGECVPGERECGPGETPRACDATATWRAQPACPYACVRGERGEKKK
jgi:hypothetical protein